MKRGQRLVLVSHCVLNQNVVVRPLARARGALAAAAEAAISSGCGIVQLPCPETAHGGLTRPPMTRDEYDCPEYRALCSDLADRVIAELRPLLADGCRIVGAIVIDGSPSCSVSKPRGVWMRELLGRPELQGVPALGIPEDACDEPTGQPGAGDGPVAAPREFMISLARMLSQ